MAKIFRRPRHLHPVAELNITNMVDLGFTLLIIFMIATPLIQQEQTIAVNLPTEVKRNQPRPPADMEFQPITIDRNGVYYFGTRRVDYKELEALVAGLGLRAKQPVMNPASAGPGMGGMSGPPSAMPPRAPACRWSRTMPTANCATRAFRCRR